MINKLLQAQELFLLFYNYPNDINFLFHGRFFKPTTPNLSFESGQAQSVKLHVTVRVLVYK